MSYWESAPGERSRAERLGETARLFHVSWEVALIGLLRDTECLRSWAVLQLRHTGGSRVERSYGKVASRLSKRKHESQLLIECAQLLRSPPEEHCRASLLRRYKGLAEIEWFETSGRFGSRVALVDFGDAL